MNDPEEGEKEKNKTSLSGFLSIKNDFFMKYENVHSEIV